jgi:hypothetical protein
VPGIGTTCLVKFSSGEAAANPTDAVPGQGQGVLAYYLLARFLGPPT